MITIASMALTAQAFAPTKFGGQRQLSSPLNMVAVDTSDIKTGMTVELEGEPYKILSFSIMKQGRGVARTTVSTKTAKNYLLLRYQVVTTSPCIVF